MKVFGYYLLRIFVITLAIASSLGIHVEDAEDVTKVQAPNVAAEEAVEQQRLAQEQTKETKTNEARGLASSYEVNENYDDGNDEIGAFGKHAKPLKNIFMGIYKNYKSTYLGNKTSLEYKQRLRNRVNMATALAEAKAAEALKQQEAEEEDDALLESNEDNDEIMQAAEAAIDTESLGELTRRRIRERLDLITALAREEQKQLDDLDGVSVEEEETFRQPAAEPHLHLKAKAAEESESTKTHKKRRKRKRKTPAQAKTAEQLLQPSKQPAEGTDEAETENDELEQVYHYDIGGGVNVSLDTQDDIVSIKLDGNNLLEVVSGRWLHDNTEEGRGKKYEMVTKVLPLFILPFLIQSAIVPFLVTKLKLLLVKSILVGKLAIFLLIISAIKNSNKPMQTYEVAPSYWAGEPSRRSELASAASSMAYNGYRVEGKPAAWIN